jgi:hypothetical protein
VLDPLGPTGVTALMDAAESDHRDRSVTARRVRVRAPLAESRKPCPDGQIAAMPVASSRACTLVDVAPSQGGTGLASTHGNPSLLSYQASNMGKTKRGAAQKCSNALPTTDHI